MGWLSVLGWVALGLGFASALAIVVLEVRRREPSVMSVVHPVTALYLGPAWLWLYLRGRRAPVAHAVSHCGAGCTLGDIGGEWILFAVGVDAFGWELGLDFALAWTLGILFQYATIGSLRRAVQADTLSIVAFEVGLFGWMALARYVLFSSPPAVDTSGHWLVMQVGMILGFATAWPANVWLLRRGVKEPM
ncbi:MAG TPA: DUF4396 domain-containing protein [Gaiellaceae bacterium]|nr:DUF4396 domain-containing protein [Gaiellaceae bacterium]